VTVIIDSSGHRFAATGNVNAREDTLGQQKTVAAVAVIEISPDNLLAIVDPEANSHVIDGGNAEREEDASYGQKGKAWTGRTHDVVPVVDSSGGGEHAARDIDRIENAWS
jgi:hypothetical protein